MRFIEALCIARETNLGLEIPGISTFIWRRVIPGWNFYNYLKIDAASDFLVMHAVAIDIGLKRIPWVDWNYLQSVKSFEAALFPNQY